MNKDMEEQEVEDNKTLEQNNIQKTVNIDDFQNICRGCMSRNDLNEIETVQYSDGTKLKDLYKTYFSIDINLSTILPQNICMDCTYNIFNFYSLTQQVIKSENIFKNIFEQQFVKYEESEYANDNKFEILMEEAEENVESDEEPPPLTPNDESPEDNISKKNLEEPEEVVVEEPEEETTPKEIIKPNDAQKNVTKQGKKQRLKECEICHKNVDSSKRSQHMRIHTGEKPFSCSICHQSFNIMGNLRRHQMIHTGEKPHVCNICGRGFHTMGDLKRHLQKHCDLQKDCDGLSNSHSVNIIAYNVKDDVEENNMTSVENKLVCNYCDISFNETTLLKDHLEKAHLLENLCIVCDETFDNEDELHRHESLHTNERPFVCTLCDKNFAQSSCLKMHVKIHKDIRQFLCEYCNKGFYSKGNLNVHLRKHTGEKPFICSLCGKNFVGTNTLKKHFKTHQYPKGPDKVELRMVESSNKRPFACSMCNKTFKEKSHLRGHLKLHSGEKPYTCTYCEKKFASKGNWNVHVRLHEGQKPYVCLQCGKGFTHPSRLKIHGKIHRGVDEYGQDEDDVEYLNIDIATEEICE